ncbi:M14 family metallopeptidase [Neobacillus sp. PS3-34]|uniref:M14 family metallopeptidase n=1 Tax=Neobacillus sp. PS3-34 TaxID=3070678 RepID=UPI0027E1856E|nr:M14 family metallopeptidase [Neobacillus sp. PS3-34]WML48569.1 M14 family metallopeptidase [Neobacillus sp. PS3-34]
MDYIDGISKVYPTTGSIQLFRKAELAAEYHNPTDRERFWLFFMNEVMPEIVELLPLGKVGLGKTAPFFSRLLVEIFMSEEERKLGIEEERISSLEALHEDIYFNVLDYFEHLGKNKTGLRWDAPGGVHPFMHIKQGAKPSARIELYGFTPQVKNEVSTKTLRFSSNSIEPVSCIIQASSGEERLLFHEQWESISLPAWNEEVEKLASLPGVHSWLGGISYEGCVIPVLDVIKPSAEDFYSPHKLSLYKPTILIETGHHANEVSSSPAVREMVKEIVEGQQDLLNKVNIIVIPTSNPDGSNLHSILAADNPEWKHHAARYNAVGLEFANVRYKNTIFGEADVVPNAIHRWLPDVLIDGHGIPGHEWIQPFAGFSSPPRFPVSYSIPNAFIYGITRDLDKNQFPEHRRIQDFLISGVTEKIRKIEAIRTKNEYWRNRYRKYGTQWLPDYFPIEEQDGMNFYHWDTKVDQASHVYISRYPEWCSADFITEAADETVYGDTLAGCIYAQKSFYLGVIENMAACKSMVRVTSENGYIKNVRKRPLQST